ncbi:hypothetical protein PanWU01x14_171850 [Parasponia andersonii]|uniref:Uncharacterized protein n=1 Tax=Parasponia andersonii TaxID=3476 RepID=A0A2P5C9C0_PARAD|nr:hypothetical protein PanWU01x14_171850 [Parasponia andersonii]
MSYLDNSIDSYKRMVFPSPSHLYVSPSEKYGFKCRPRIVLLPDPLHYINDLYKQIEDIEHESFNMTCERNNLQQLNEFLRQRIIELEAKLHENEEKIQESTEEVALQFPSG